jgi:hypothetical protein
MGIKNHLLGYQPSATDLCYCLGATNSMDTLKKEMIFGCSMIRMVVAPPNSGHHNKQAKITEILFA